MNKLSKILDFAECSTNCRNLLKQKLFVNVMEKNRIQIFTSIFKTHAAIKN